MKGDYVFGDVSNQFDYSVYMEDLPRMVSQFYFSLISIHRWANG